MMRLFRNEQELMKGITRNARQLGFLVFHIDIPQHSDAGFPDIVICGHGIVRWIETKGPRGTISERQQRWIDELTYAGQNARFAWIEEFDEIMQDLETAYEQDHHRRAQERADTGAPVR